MSSIRFAAPPITPILKQVLHHDPQRYSPLLAYLMGPVSFAAYVMAAWRFSADMDWVGQFFISSGLFSRWQVWLLLAIAMHTASRNLNRPGDPKDGPAVQP